MRTDVYAHAPRLPETSPLDPADLFGGDARRIELEIGPGRGWFIVERLEAAPDAALIGLEIRRKWATIVDQRLQRRGLHDRARVFAEDARQVLPRFKDACLDVVYIHFPDPWWKKRHHKRLVVGADVLREIGRVLKPGGELFVQTDVAERAQAYEHAVSLEPALAPWGESPRVHENPYDARSPRERRAVQDGLPIHRLRYRRANGS